MKTVVDKNLPKVAIVGRQNVGKSALFNTITDEKKALVSAVPGTTRDINSATVRWRDFNFELVDTAGLSEGDKLDQIEEDAAVHAKAALESADLIIFVVDAKAEIMLQDRAVAKLLKKNLPAL